MRQHVHARPFFTKRVVTCKFTVLYEVLAIRMCAVHAVSNGAVLQVQRRPVTGPIADMTFSS